MQSGEPISGRPFLYDLNNYEMDKSFSLYLRWEKIIRGDSDMMYKTDVVFGGKHKHNNFVLNISTF